VLDEAAREKGEEEGKGKESIISYNGEVFEKVPLPVPFCGGENSRD